MEKSADSFGLIVALKIIGESMTNRFFRKSDKFFKIGAILVVFFSLAVGFLNVGVLYLFGIPIIGLLSGLILVWLSKVTFNKKAVLTFLPVFLIPSAFFIFLYLNKAEPETFLIPENFRGRIVIFYEESCAEKPLYENGRRLYRFPDDGILITKFKRPKGFLDRKFYFVNERGERTPIVQRDVRDFNFKGRISNVENEPSRDETAAFYSHERLHIMTSNSKTGFIISTFRYFEKDEKESWNESRQFSENAEKSLKICRHN